MNLEEYASLIGKLAGNLQSLEYMLRVYLYDCADPPHEALPGGLDLHSLKVGDNVPVNALTDYSTFGQLITRYNRRLGQQDPMLKIDRSIVKVRDALAHGRIASPGLADDNHLIKFTPPREGRTVVSFSQPLSEQWLKEQVSRTRTELFKVYTAAGYTPPVMA